MVNCVNSQNNSGVLGVFGRNSKLSIEKIHDQCKNTYVSTSSKSSNIRLLQWRTEVFGHKGQLYKVLLHHIAFLIFHFRGIFFIYFF